MAYITQVLIDWYCGGALCIIFDPIYPFEFYIIKEKNDFKNFEEHSSHFLYMLQKTVFESSRLHTTPDLGSHITIDFCILWRVNEANKYWTDKKEEKKIPIRKYYVPYNPLRFVCIHTERSHTIYFFLISWNSLCVTSNILRGRCT